MFDVFGQKTFNLQREENEGYSKLIIEITQVNLGPENWKIVLQNVQKLVGFFSLNSIRVLDIILASFQFNLDNLTYLDLIKGFGHKDTAIELLGFRLKNLEHDQE